MDDHVFDLDVDTLSCRESLIDCIIYTAAQYIQHWRRKESGSMCPLEIEFMYCDEFEQADDPRQWLKDNMPETDNNLILYVIDNYEEMEPCNYKVQIHALFNMLEHT